MFLCVLLCLHCIIFNPAFSCHTTIKRTVFVLYYTGILTSEHDTQIGDVGSQLKSLVDAPRRAVCSLLVSPRLRIRSRLLC